MPPVRPPPGRLVRLGVVLPTDTEAARELARLCDLAGIDALWVDDEVSAARVAAVVSRATVGVRPAAEEPWARTIAVSIGRTSAEARARAALDHTFTSDAVVGTLEHCQQRVAEFAHAGVTDVRCRLPDTADVHDVVAQLTAISVGSVITHVPDAPRSPDPPPPPWAAPRP